MATEHREREDKYDVGAGFVLPDLGDLVAPGGHVRARPAAPQGDAAAAQRRR